MSEQRVKISDIAEELGLSTATVSNVIHGKTKKTSEETIKRVQALLEERQYIPSMAGILLAQNSSKIIGVFLNDHEKYEGHALDDAFIASSLNCLSNEIEKQGQFMMIKKAKRPEEIIRFASMWNMDGLVVIGFCSQDYHYLRNHMRIPFVVYDGFCKEPERFFNITIDNYGGGFQVGELFRKYGHRQALCISDNDTDMDRERYNGFIRGFAPGEAGLMLIPMHRKERFAFYQENIGKFHQITAVFAVSDYYAVDLMHFLQENGFSVPKDISVAGFDNIPMCEMVSPALTTVSQDNAARAAMAIARLRELKERQLPETSAMLPVKLIERASVRRNEFTTTLCNLHKNSL